MPVLDRCAVANSASLCTWNVNQRATLLQQQADRVLRDAPDVLCLQEVGSNALPRWTDRLNRAGYAVEPSMPITDAPGGRFGVLIASRHPLARVAQPIDVPWPQRVLVADVRLPGWTQALRVVCLHAPIRDDPDTAKIRTFEAVSTSLAALPDHVPAVLCGDLNAPWGETLDGTIITFGQTPKGKVHGGVGAREDAAERAILRPPGWCDAFRALHGYDVSGHSWKATNGYRLDHILLSSHLVSVECEYDHDVRTGHMSDHSAMFATFAPATLPPTSSS